MPIHKDESFMQKILSLMRQAVQVYNMIDNKDVIAVGVSGGKDSLVLLTAMHTFKSFCPKKFDIKAITIDSGFENTDFTHVKKMCKELDIEYIIEKTDIKEIVFDRKKEKSPCSLCSKMRRAALCTAAKNAGCNKIALGHNRDDAIETFIMNTINNGNAMCFEPVTMYEDIDLMLIRPLVYAPEYIITKCAKEHNLPVVNKFCPADGNTKREETKRFISDIRLINKNASKNIFTAIKKLPEFKKYEVTSTGENDE